MMKEFPFTIKDFKGLRPHSRIPRNNPNILDACYNVRVGKFGLEPYEGITQPYTGLPTISHPFPQLVSTLDGDFIATSSAIYEVNTDFSLTSLLSSGISGSGRWHLADFHIYQVWTNGTTLLERDDARLFSVKSMPHTVGTVCAFREGQLITGNLGTGYNNFVAFSEIGRVGDLTKLLQPESIRNEAGYLPMLGGTVLRVKELLDCVIVYCTDCIIALIPSAQTFGRKVLSHTGIINGDAVDGDVHTHVYVDALGRVNRITKDKLFPENLWYDEYITGMSASDLIVTFDDGLDDFYFSDGSVCYQLSPQGMSKVLEVPTSIARVNGTLYGVRKQGADASGYITTTMFDFGIAGIKTLMGVQINGDGTSLTAAVDYRFGTSGAFTTGSAKPASIHGSVTPIVAGNQMKLRIASSDYSTFMLDELNVRWKMTDKRGIRGIYNVSNKNAEG